MWTREDGDPTIFDLRFVIGDADVGFAATIRAPNGELTGTVPVTFPTKGQFLVKAVDFENGDAVIASTSLITVSTNASSSPDPSTASATTPPTPPPTVTTIATTLTVTTAVPTNLGTNPSPTSTSVIAGATQTPSSAASKSSINTPAIVGGILGGVILILLLAIAYVLTKRRRENARIQRRLTFHRDLMVQHRPIAPDIEHGPGIATSPILPPLGFQQAITVSTPQGPTRPQFPGSLHAHSPAPVDHPPTHRQVLLGSRIVQLEQQFAGIRRQNRGNTMVPVLEHMKRQVEWLRAERDSPWARCETDVPSPLLDYYLE
ncbi:hypothetical protein C0991_007144 [Blastosporella zonata]|nr:hypothetical protein C0991_007144 [Blastosporella zonata]